MTTHNPGLAAASIGRTDEVSVIFYLYTGDDWPPYPGEAVAARFVAPFVVEVIGVPRYAYGINRGDRVAVTHDGLGWIGRHVKSFGGHSTVRVVATTTAELEPIADALLAAGVRADYATETTMLAVDVPPTVALRAVLSILDAAISMTCDYEIAGTPDGVVRGYDTFD